jgi:hypothetical protein
MSKQQYFLAFLATNLLLALTNKSAMGFTLKFGNGATSYYNPTAPYVIDANTRGTTFLSPRYVAPIKLGGTNDFLKMLNNDVRWQGWDFVSSNKNLYGNFEISDYYGCGSQTICAKERPKGTIRGGVGAYINIKYNPKKTDPKPGQGKIHWIQRVVNNHSIYDEQQSTSDGGLHGFRYDGIDIPLFQNANPYYRGGNEFSSFDRPYRIDADKSHSWFADLYLVEEIAPKTVKIYNGVRWGWINRVYRRQNPLPILIPKPNEPILIPRPIPIPIPIPVPVPIVCNPGSGGGGCSRTADGMFDEENTNQEISYFNFDETNSTEEQEQEQPSFDINDPDWIEEQDPSVLEIENMKSISEEDAWHGENEEDEDSPVSVPESTSTLGLLALGAWGIVKALKIRKNK